MYSLSLLASASSVLLASGTLANSVHNQPWPAAKAWAWYTNQPWLAGCNYLPSSAVNDIEMWRKDTFDPQTIDRELAWARQLGFNSVRVFLNFVVWQTDAEGLKNRFELFLALAARHGISVIPILLDDCNFGNEAAQAGPQKPPVPGVHNSRWVSSPPLAMVTDTSAWHLLEHYVKNMVSTFGADQRIVMWDLYNEPGGSGLGNKSLPLVEATFRWARESKPSNPLTMGVWGAPEEISARQIALSDIVSFHFYGDGAGLKHKINDKKNYNRPVVCTEWMARTMGSSWTTDLPVFKETGVGCYSWGLVQGKTQTFYPWGSPENAPEPKVWFHDLLRPDGTPYDEGEVTAIRQVTGRSYLRSMKPLFDYPVRDTSICVGPDKQYYLTGTTGAPDWWKTNPGIRVWRSKDLKTWEPLGLVWSFEKNAAWQELKGDQLAIWAPEIHYFNNTFWIPYCVNYGGTGILKSKTGKAEGPYEDIKKDGPLTGEIDASLFRDDDGKVYFVYQNGKIARMKDDMSALTEEPRLLKPANAPHVGFEGAFIFKANDRYYLSCAEFMQGRYHCYVASSTNLFGPYGNRYLSIPHGGHNMFFKDADGGWRSTFFGNDGDAPFRERPGILRVAFGLDGLPRPAVVAGER